MLGRRRVALGPAAAVALITLATLTACGGASSEDAEQAIGDHSQGRLADPDCEEVDTDFYEMTYHCSAARRDGRRIKLLVALRSDQPRAALILAWPCVPAGAPWRAVRQHRCAEVVWQGHR